MYQEHEIKVLDINMKKVCEQLEKMGAKKKYGKETTYLQHLIQKNMPI